MIFSCSKVTATLKSIDSRGYALDIVPTGWFRLAQRVIWNLGGLFAWLRVRAQADHSNIDCNCRGLESVTITQIWDESRTLPFSSW